jgi:tetratricopeptide (TPR) repeat protein
VWLAPLTLVVVTPTFRVNPRELLYLLPAVGLFSGLAVEMFGDRRVRSAVFGFLLCASLLLDCFGVRAGSLGPSVSDQTTAVLDRPRGWSSREATQWLRSQLKPDDAMLVMGLGFTDPAVIQLHEAGVTMYAAATNWERLRDSASKIKYTVFVDDPRVYAPEFVRYADAHFTIPADTRFPGYTIYDCRKDGRFVAYPDALNSADAYIQRGTSLLQSKQCDKAIEAFQTAVQIDPHAVGGMRDLMLACLECDRKEDAVRVGAELLQSEAADPVINANMAILDFQLGRIEDGLVQCRKNIQLNIAPAISYGVLGQLLEKQGNLRDARDAYVKSLSFDPGNAVTARLLANMEEKLKQSNSVR